MMIYVSLDPASSTVSFGVASSYFNLLANAISTMLESYCSSAIDLLRKGCTMLQEFAAISGSIGWAIYNIQDWERFRRVQCPQPK